MKKIFTLCVVLCLSYLTMGASTPKHEFRATWLATVSGIDWPKTKATNDATREQQKQELIDILDKMKAGNLNAVCFQVRSLCDAMYQSSYEPWSIALTGTRGKDPGYDPLQFAIDEAHKRGMELHVWVNPFRASTSTLAATDMLWDNAGDWLIKYNNSSFSGYLIDPGYPESRAYVVKVLMEIINNYDVDGLVMDDYFYAYGGTTNQDSVAQALHYRASEVIDVNNNGNKIDDWRRSNVDNVIKAMYDSIQVVKPWVRFGMGPGGIWSIDKNAAEAYGLTLPSGIRGSDPYTELYCNTVEWIKQGWVDYVNPQIYWSTQVAAQDYDVLCQWWSKDVCEHFSNLLPNGKKVHHFPSPAAYKVYGDYSGYEDGVEEMKREMDANRKNLSSGYTGAVFYNTTSYLQMSEELAESHFTHTALAPPMEWKVKGDLAAPTNLQLSGTTLSWQHPTAERFTVYAYPKGIGVNTATSNPQYLQAVVYDKSFNTSSLGSLDDITIAVYTYDRYGVEHGVALYNADPNATDDPEPEPEPEPEPSNTITWELNGGEVNTSSIEVPSQSDLMLQFMNNYTSYFGTPTSDIDAFYPSNISGFLYRGFQTRGKFVNEMMLDESAGWKWLADYIVSTSASNPTIVAALNSGTEVNWRYSIAAFFEQNGSGTYNVDFSTAGQPSKWGTAYQIAHGAVLLPTYVTSAFTLPIPTHPEGHDFLGWYDNAEFIGSPLTTISADWTGSLYAKWQEDTPTIDPTWQITYTSTDGNIVTPTQADVFGANIVSNTYENGVGTITFDGPVTSIGECAFLNRNFLYSITIPNRVTSLGDDAFCCCGNLTSIFIPNSVAYIESGVFSSCTSLASIVVEDNNEYYDNRNNCNAIIETKTNTLVAGCKNTIIPNSVTRIGDEAFNGCEFLPFISIPNSVTSIGSYAFYGCSSLTSITIPNSVTSIGKYVFYACRALTSMVIDSDNNHYDSRENCNAIIETATNTLISGCQNTIIPSSVTSIGARAFSLCNSLTSITIPNSVISIWDEAFEECSGLTSITIPNSVTNIGDKAFFYCSNLTSVIIGNSVTSIGNGAFSGCSKLNTIHVEATIPPALEDSTVFMNTPSPTCYIPCGTLAVYEASDWASQVSSFVEDCPPASAAITYVLNGGVQSEWETPQAMYNELNALWNTFSGTSKTWGNLENLKANVANGIPTQAGTMALDFIADENFKENFEWLVTYMDAKCTEQGQTLPSSNASFLRYNLQAFFIDGMRTSWPISADYTICGVSTVEAYQPYWKSGFANPTNPTEEFILNAPYKEGYTFAGWYTNADFSGEKVTTINAETTGTLYAKWINNDWIITYTSTDGNIVTPYKTDVFGANIVNNEYKDGQGVITFDGPVTSIGNIAFNGCSSLSSITIPNSVTSIGDRAFSSCDSLISIVVEDGNATYDSRTNCNAIIETATNTLIAGCQNTIIPNSVTSIGSHAFSNCSSLTSITIPNSVTSIGDRAFRYCTSLTSITIPNSVMSIGEVAFYHCTSLASVVIPESVTSIGDWAFSYCTSLASVVIPESVTSIGDRAFVYCSGLTSVTIPNSVTSIGDYTFLGCSSITSMVVESGNTTYDSRENCNAIIETATNTLITGCQNTVIPNSVTSIGQTAFYCCYSLRSIALPNNITTIGDSAFFDCTSLMSVTIPGSVRLIGTNAFYNCTNIAKTNFLGDIEDWCNIEFERYSSNPITYSHNLYINDQEINDVVIPNTIDSIKRYTFYRCASLTSVTLPDGITTIGERAFTSCTSLKSLTIPESVTFIADAAFALCESLETMYIHAITPPILEGEILFTGSPISTCYIPCGTLAAYESSAWASQVGEFIEEGCPTVQMCGDNLYWEYADGVLTITGTGDMYDYAADADVPWYDVHGNIKTVSLPDAMTKIGQNAFYKCTAMTSINMPTSLTAIGEKAFAQDTKLACEIILPASMTTIASRAFFNCKAVTAFRIEATTPPTIPNDAFERTTAPIHVPCGYGHIYGKHAQWGVLNLEMCELLQDNVYYYPIDSHTARAVTYHSNPTDTIVIPSAVVIDGVPRTVTEVADFAFTDCANLPAIYFSEGLEYIGERAFVRCYGLQGTIVLPATLETIGERAFSYCNNVDRYTIQAMTPPVLGANAFTGDNKNALFYISCEAMDDYKVATNWSSLKSRLRDACLNIYHYNTALGANGVHTTEDTLVASIYYRRQFTTSRWETLYLPFEVDRVTVLEDGVEYDLTAWDIVNGGHYYLAKPYGIENKEVVFAFTQVVDAQTPYIIQFKEPYFHDKMITFHGKESWNKLSSSFEALPISFEMQMAGNTTLQDQILNQPVYMLRGTSNFILQNTTTTLHPFECYVMPYATPSGTPARMNVRFRGDVPTAVESVKGNESHLTYTVDGYTLTVYPQGQAFSIYSLNGALIYSCEAGKEAVDCELNSGCYLLHAGAEAHKIML